MFKYKITNNKKIDKIDNYTLKVNTNKKIFKSSNLLQKAIGLTQNARKEKQKIEEFKNLLEQIVNEIEK